MLITCDIPEAPRPITYSLIASQGLLVTKKVVHDYKPVSFKINITLKSSPDLLTYSCQAASHSGAYGPSTRLQMYWELWASEYRGEGGRLAGCGLMEGWGERRRAAEWRQGADCLPPRLRPVHGDQRTQSPSRDQKVQRALTWGRKSRHGC